MNIFGMTIVTKKDLEQRVVDLSLELEAMKETFPLTMGQVVYDVALKNSKGRYTKTNPSIEYSTITEVTVDEKNYFNLVNRYKRNDVFFTHEAAERCLKSVCK